MDQDNQLPQRAQTTTSDNQPHVDFAAHGRTGTIPTPPIGELLGFVPGAIGNGESLVTLEASARHANPMGTLHGGVLCDIADAAMGLAFASTLGPGESFTTLELKINFLRPVWNAQLRAIGRVIKRGRAVGLVECDVFDEREQLIAHATSTCMTLRDEMAKGR
ncbi:MAG: PaaI family thioesterase [Ktedonobacterales bacterium]